MQYADLCTSELPEVRATDGVLRNCSRFSRDLSASREEGAELSERRDQNGILQDLYGVLPIRFSAMTVAPPDYDAGGSRTGGQLQPVLRLPRQGLLRDGQGRQAERPERRQHD
jgi:hypothetical protein